MENDDFIFMTVKIGDRVEISRIYSKLTQEAWEGENICAKERACGCRYGSLSGTQFDLNMGQMGEVIRVRGGDILVMIVGSLHTKWLSIGQIALPPTEHVVPSVPSIRKLLESFRCVSKQS